jgi:hypothetical protein
MTLRGLMAIGMLLLFINNGFADNGVSFQVKSNRAPVDLIIVGNQIDQDSPLKVLTTTPDVVIEAGSIVVPASVKSPVVLNLLFSTSQAEGETFPTLQFICDYCRLKIRSLPSTIFLNGQSLQVSVSDTKALNITAHTVILDEVSSVDHLEIKAQNINAKYALISAKNLEANSDYQCVWGGPKFEVSIAQINCIDGVIMYPQILQSDSLTLKGKRATLQFRDTTIAKLTLELDRLSGWFYENVKISDWAGQIKQARVFTHQDQPEFVRDAAYSKDRFLVFGDPILSELEKPLKKHEEEGSEPSLKRGPLAISSGFIRKISPQVQQMIADKLADGKSENKGDSDAKGVSRQGVF